MKKAEITTQQIVMLIILIVSFAVILFLIFRLDLASTNKEEICHNSVVMRGNSILPEDTVSLNCHRKYLCITKDGDCTQMTKPVIKKVETSEEIYNVLAEEMISCWWMFGEGQIDYIGDKVTKKNYCSICSQILFDDSLNKLEDVDEKISKDNLYDYMVATKIKDKEITYSEYLFGTNEINSLKQLALEQYNVQGTFGEIEVGKQYFIVMGITNEVGGVVKWAGLIGTGVGVVVGGILIGSNPVGWVAGAIILGTAGVAGGAAAEKISDSISPEIAALTIPGKGIDNEFMAPTIQEVDSAKFKSLNCKDILTLS